MNILIIKVIGLDKFYQLEEGSPLFKLFVELLDINKQLPELERLRKEADAANEAAWLENKGLNKPLIFAAVRARKALTEAEERAKALEESLIEAGLGACFCYGFSSRKEVVEDPYW